MQNKGAYCLKSVFIRKDQREFLCTKNLRNSNVNENALNSEGSLMHYKVRHSNCLFQLFLTLQVRPEENSSYFSNIQPCTITCTLDAFIKYKDTQGYLK